MEPGDVRSRKERDETDASLASERDKTDVELAKTRDSSEQAADEVVEVARGRAEVTLRAARAAADDELADPTPREELARERTVEDATIADERSRADARLQVERDERARALAALLRLERDATDEGLLVERARADEQVATRDDFLAMVSHDLRAMLGGIALSAGLLGKASSARTHAERIQRLTARMNRLVGDLLDLVSLEAGQLQVTLRPDDAGEVVHAAIEAFAPSYAARGVTLTGADPGAFPIDLDHDRILQVLANLLSNSLKFTGPGGTVSVHVASTDAGVQVSVVDTGRGIPEGKETAIFERFEQAGPRDGGGVGLGLYIAKSIIDSHGGTIWAERPAAGGAAVHFTLPRAPVTA